MPTYVFAYLCICIPIHSHTYAYANLCRNHPAKTDCQALHSQRRAVLSRSNVSPATHNTTHQTLFIDGLPHPRRTHMHHPLTAVGGPSRASQVQLPVFIAVRAEQPSASSSLPSPHILSVLQPSALAKAQRTAMRAALLRLRAAQPSAPSPPSSQDGRGTPADTPPCTTPPPLGLLSPPDSTRKTTASETAAANRPAQAAFELSNQNPKRKQDPLRLLDFTPPDLRSLLDSSFPPDRHIRIPHVSPADFDRWEALHGPTRTAPEHRSADPRNHGFTYTYNTLTKAFIVQCMPTPFHTSVQRFFNASAQNSLNRTFGIDNSSDSGLLVGHSNDIKGFKGIKGLRIGGTKIPDFAIRARGTKYPSVAMECGFSEYWADLLCDAGLLLVGTKGQTRLVILVKLKEKFPTAADVRANADGSGNRDDGDDNGDDDDNDDDDDNGENDDNRAPASAPRSRTPGKHDWPTGIDAPILSRQQDAATHDELLEGKSEELATWLLKSHSQRLLGRYPLIGKITATAHVYCRTEEAASLRSELGIAGEDEDDGEDDEDQQEQEDGASGMAELWPQITPIYRYTFMTDDLPTTPATTPVTNPSTNPITSTPASRSPSTLQIPLHLLFPASRAPASLAPHHLSSHIIFDFANLGAEVLNTAEDMLEYRADDRAAIMLRKWKKTWDASAGVTPAMSIRGTKRGTGSGRGEEADATNAGGESMKEWKRQKRLEVEDGGSGSGSGSGSGGNGNSDDGDEEWTPDCD